MEDTNSKPKSKKYAFLITSIIITCALISTVVYVALKYKQPITMNTESDVIVAKVNDSPITKKEFNLAMNGVVKLINLGKVDTTKEVVQQEIMVQALNDVINTEVLVQKAKQSNIVVDKVLIEDEINKVISNLGGRDNYISMLKSLNISEEEMRRDMEKQLLVTLYGQKIFDPIKNVVSETEIKVFYNALQDKYIEQGSIAPDLELIREKISNMILERKREVLLEEEAKKLRKDSKIEILI